MSAEVFDPADLTSITMTPSARAHVRRQLAREGAEALRLGIAESGCNGYMYELSYLDGEVCSRVGPFALATSR